MSEKLKPTPGPWIADNNEGFSPWTIWSRMTPSGNGAPGPVVARIDGDSAEADDSALLIAEAGTVFHECGLSPRELMERCSAMEAALNACKDALEWVVEQGGGPTCEHEGGVVCFCKENNAINAARAALAKHKEV